MRYALGILLILTVSYSCHVETKRLAHFEVHGIDVSHYQAKIDWKVVATQDISFTFIKATEGSSMQDSLFARNWPGAQQAGIMRGAYHFYRPTVSTSQQVKNFTSTVHLATGDFPPVLDVEVRDGVSKKALIKGIRNWLEAIEQHYSVRPIIYTNLKFYNKYIADHFSGYPIWIARYNHEAPELGDGTKWHFWQYGNKGRLPGIVGDVDFNVFHGNKKELQDLGLGSKTLLSLDF